MQKESMTMAPIGIHAGDAQAQARWRQVTWEGLDEWATIFSFIGARGILGICTFPRSI